MRRSKLDKAGHPRSVSSNGCQSTSPRSRRLLAGLLLIVMTAVAYVPAIRGGFIWDDDDYVTRNDTLRSVAGLGRIWCEIGATPQYYPMVHTSYWLEYRLWGLNPAGYHLVNVLLHATSVLLFWRLLAVLRLPGAYLAAAIFALHPVHVESVAWITERKNVLSGLFYLAAALAYLRFAFEPGPAAPSRVRLGWYAIAIVLFLFAILSKTVAGSLPAGLLLVLWWKRGRLRLADIRPLLPFFALALALGSLTAWMERNHVGALGAEWRLSFVERCLIAGRAVWFYAGKLVWPVDLTFVYPRWQIDATCGWQYLYPAVAMLVLITLWFGRSRWGRGPLVAVLLFVGTLFPALGFFNVYPMRYSFVADHFQYLASLGLIALAAASGARVVARLPDRGRTMTIGCAACVLLCLGTLTWRQGRIYAGLESLWLDTLAKNPAAWMAHNNLGNILQGRGDLAGALAHFNESLRLKNDEAEGHNNLAGVLNALGRYDAAAREAAEALRLDSDYWSAHRNSGIVLARLGRTAEAIDHYRIALKTHPDDSEVCNNLAWLLATSPDDAIRRPEEAVRLAERAAGSNSASNPFILDTLAAAYASVGRFDRATEVARRALAQLTGPRNAETAAAVRTRIELYQQGRAYREPADAHTRPAPDRPTTRAES